MEYNIDTCKIEITNKNYDNVLHEIIDILTKNHFTYGEAVYAFNDILKYILNNVELSTTIRDGIFN